ncbi:MAG: TonB family protein [Bdellovibrionales bacterium]|nr:TonB family protein [Bdellovibrionales bacterium]
MSEIHPNQGNQQSSGKKYLKDWVAQFRTLDADGRGVSIRLQKPRLVIGSVESADIRLGGEGVAPIHAVLELTREGSPNAILDPVIFDLASESGVRVNGIPVVTGPITTGDTIEIGRHRLSFTLSELDAVEPPARVQAGKDQLFRRADEDFSSLLSEEPPETEIFDYSASSRSALEVVMAWRGLILDIQHFTKDGQVRVGDSINADFGIPAILSNRTHVLVSIQGEQRLLHIDPKMKGVFHRGGKLERVESLASSSIAFGSSEFAKISAGEVDFYLASTSAPPRLRAGSDRRRDAFLAKTLLLSLLFTGSLFFSLSQIRVPQQIEAEQLPERIATILYQPEKYSQPRPRSRDVSKPEPAVPQPVKSAEPKVTKVDLQPNPDNANKPIPKEMNVGNKNQVAAQLPKNTRSENRAKEGEGARAKGAEGKRGQKNAGAGKTAQDLAKRPSPSGGAGVGGGGNSEAPDAGNVDLMKGATEKIQDLLGNSAARLGKDGSKLQGFGGFTTRGSGGQALSGTGQGGGGNADTLAGGLGEKGRGGGRVGTGLGAAGDGSGIIGGKTRVVIRSGGPEEAIVMGAIDASAIEAALLAHRDEFRLCYEREINAENPKLAGRVGTSFVIGPQGRVTQAGIASSSLGNVNAERCILSVIRRIDFPVPRGGGVVQVTYPFKFAPAGG